MGYSGVYSARLADGKISKLVMQAEETNKIGIGRLSLIVLTHAIYCTYLSTQKLQREYISVNVGFSCATDLEIIRRKHETCYLSV